MRNVVVLGACHAVHIARCLNSSDDLSAIPICLHMIDKTAPYPSILEKADIIVTIEALNSGLYSLNTLKEAFPKKRFVVYPYLHSPGAFPFLINANYTWNNWFGPAPTTCRIRVVHRLIEFWESTKDWDEAEKLTLNALLHEDQEKWLWLWPCREVTSKENDCPETSNLLMYAPKSRERLMLTDNHPADVIYHCVSSEILKKLNLTNSKPFPCELQTGDIIYPRYPFHCSEKITGWVAQQVHVAVNFTKRAVEGVLKSFESGNYECEPWFVMSKKFNQKYFEGKRDILYIGKRLAAGAIEGEIP
jgi:hypothetical protein